MSSFNDESNRTYKFDVTPDYFRMAAKPTGRGMQFGRTEIFQILISVAMLTVAFTFWLLGGLQGLPGTNLPTFLFFLGVSFLAVSTAFLMHELAHKRVAQRFGCFAEYRMSPIGLVLGLFTSLVGFIFALPGAVMISGRITRRENGIISLAGPLTNIVVGAVCLAFAFLLAPGTLVWAVFAIIAQIALILAVFNMLPVPPLDGSKVALWNILVYIGEMGLAIALLALYFIYVNPMWAAPA